MRVRGAAAQHWSVPLLCWLALIADGYEQFAFGASLPGLIGAEPWGLTTVGAGVIGSLSLVGALVGAVVTGTLTDVFGRRRLFIGSIAVFSVGMAASALALGVGVFTAGRFLSGIGFGGLVPVGVALAAEFAPSRFRSRALGLVLTGPPIGGVLASVAALALLAEQGFRPVYLIGALPLVTLVPLAVVLLPESAEYLRSRTTADERPSARAAVRTLFVPGNRWSTLGLWIVAPLVLLAIFGVSTWLPQVMRTAGYPIGSAVTFLLVYALGAVLGPIVCSTFAERLGAKPMLVTGALLSAAGMALIGFVPPGVGLYTLVGLAGFGAAAAQAMLSDHIAAFYPPTARATGLGWALGLGRVGAIAGPVYGALAIGSGGDVRTAALAFAAPVLLAGLVMITVGRRGAVPSGVALGSATTPVAAE